MWVALVKFPSLSHSLCRAVVHAPQHEPSVLERPREQKGQQNKIHEEKSMTFGNDQKR